MFSNPSVKKDYYIEKDIRNEMRSLGPVLCSKVRCPAKSSVTKFGSPPGIEAHTGHTTC